MRILVSGFEPFGSFKVNPSQLVVNNLSDNEFEFNIKTVILPVSFKHSFDILKKSIDSFSPSFVISIGVAKNRSLINLERVAINIMDCDLPDNDGFQPRNQTISPGNPDGMFTNLPTHQLVMSLNKKSIKNAISNSAGTYVCNYIMYKTLCYSKKMGFKSGFIHIPPFENTNYSSHSAYAKFLNKSIKTILDSLEE